MAEDPVAKAEKLLRQAESMLLEVTHLIQKAQILISAQGAPAQEICLSPDETKYVYGLHELELSSRIIGTLNRAGIHTVGELVSQSKDELLAITGFWFGSLDEVVTKLDERGLWLRPDPEH